MTCPETVVAGQTLAFTGMSFHPGAEIVSARWDGLALPFHAPAVTGDGSLSGSVTAPADNVTRHTLTVTDAAGGSADCFPNLIPARPTATPSPTPTRTPSPTPTATPGPPPGITVTPASTPVQGQPCAAIAAQYPRAPLTGNLIRAGLALTNTGANWSAAELQLWQFQNLRETDAGLRVSLPALGAGAQLTLPVSFPAPTTPGQVWYRWRLTGSPCASDWQPLNIAAAIPAPPGRMVPVDGALLNDRAIPLRWLPAPVPDGAPDVSSYEVQVMSMADGVLFDETVGDISAVFTADRDFPPANLAWRVRARSDAGWSLWTPSFYFGIDTQPPTAELTLNGVPGANGWWRSPLTARVGRIPPPPSSSPATPRGSRSSPAEPTC